MKDDNMLFIPEKRVKKLLKRLREKDREYRRKQSLEDRKNYLKAEKEGKLDEYYEDCKKKWGYD